MTLGDARLGTKVETAERRLVELAGREARDSDACQHIRITRGERHCSVGQDLGQ
jgi:hypothetical protein